MKIRFAPATNCPHGQFVVTAENIEDRALLDAFLSADPEKWQFWRHGTTHDCGLGKSSFNFGWIEKRKVEANMNDTEQSLADWRASVSAAVRQLDDSIQTLTHRVKRLEGGHIAEYAKKIDELTAALADRDLCIDTLREALNIRDRQIKERDEKIKWLESAIDRYQLDMRGGGVTMDSAG